MIEKTVSAHRASSELYGWPNIDRKYFRCYIDVYNSFTIKFKKNFHRQI